MILGIDYDTRAVHLCLLDDDTNAARYVQAPIATDPRPDKNDAFEAARNVRKAVSDAIWVGQDDAIDGWASIWLVGIEDAFHNSHRTKVAQSRIQGAILASIPRWICVVPVPAYEWKIEVLGKGHGNASKETVAAWATAELGEANDSVVFGPQDALDAYCIARAVRTLNDQAIPQRGAA